MTRNNYKNESIANNYNTSDRNISTSYVTAPHAPGHPVVHADGGRVLADEPLLAVPLDQTALHARAHLHAVTTHSAAPPSRPAGPRA